MLRLELEAAFCHLLGGEWYEALGSIREARQHLAAGLHDAGAALIKDWGPQERLQYDP